MDITLTHGVLPTKEKFALQFYKCVSGMYYHIENDSIIGTDKFTCDELWNIIQQFYNSDDPHKVELVSCIFETLSIEWV